MVEERYKELAELSDEIARCGRCGFCQEICPVYHVSSDESGVARGRNMFAAELVSGRLDLSRANEAFFSQCLLCRACVEMCFSGVKTDEVVLAGRRCQRRMSGTAPVHRYIFERLLPDHHRLGRVIRMLGTTRRIAPARLGSALGMFGWLGKGFARAERFSREIPREFLRARLARRKVTDKASKRAAFFIGCGINFMFPHVGEATATILAALGYEVSVVDHGCCGLPAFSHGELQAARRLASLNMAAFARDPDRLIVTDCSSCASFLKDYPRLFSTGEAADPEKLRETERFAARVKDMTEILAENPRIFEAEEGTGHAVRGKVTFHEPCHLGRYQGLGAAACETLGSLSGVDFVEMKEASWCCGGAGAFAVEHPRLSLEILDRKTRNVKSSGADTVATTCPSCLMQIKSGVENAGIEVRVAHLVEIAREHLPAAGKNSEGRRA
ncbi:MAG: (Fe-S)-binding protein [Candidatus Abyssubacteria bacterium]|nr:(Fe-S)-binding protein [Candidatus Abyssubacteria bacterium]